MKYQQQYQTLQDRYILSEAKRKKEESYLTWSLVIMGSYLLGRILLGIIFKI